MDRHFAAQQRGHHLLRSQVGELGARGNSRARRRGLMAGGAVALENCGTVGSGSERGACEGEQKNGAHRISAAVYHSQDVTGQDVTECRCGCSHDFWRPVRLRASARASGRRRRCRRLQPHRRKRRKVRGVLSRRAGTGDAQSAAPLRQHALDHRYGQHARRAIAACDS